MAHLFVAIFFLVFGLNMLLGLALPIWIMGILAIVAGIMLLIERYGRGPLPRG